MNCQNCRSWVFGECVIQNAAMGKNSLCNAWELSLSWEQVGTMQLTSDRVADLLQSRIAGLEAVIEQLIEIGDQLAYFMNTRDPDEAQTYNCWQSITKGWEEREG